MGFSDLFKNKYEKKLDEILMEMQMNMSNNYKDNAQKNLEEFESVLTRFTELNQERNMRTPCRVLRRDLKGTLIRIRNHIGQSDHKGIAKV